ncbi:WxL domain-containing protein [Enterococcus sp. LJL120]
MKFKRLCAAALVAAVGASVVGPTAASAVETELPSTGSVKVQQGVIDTPGTDLGDPEDDEKDILVPDEGDDINENPETGPLVLMRTTDYNFNLPTKTGQPAYLENTGTLQSLYASPVTVQVYDKGADFTDPANLTEVTRGALVQFGDIEDSVQTGNYTVSAKLSTQFTNATSHVLEGATIDFSNGLLATQTEGAVAPTTFNTSFTLAYNTDQPVVVNPSSNKGIFTAEFGQSAGYTVAANSLGYTGVANTDKSSVKLTVPAATTASMETTSDYTAVVTWSIARTA